jgi:hypothetical protein
VGEYEVPDSDGAQAPMLPPAIHIQFERTRVQLVTSDKRLRRFILRLTPDIRPKLSEAVKAPDRTTSRLPFGGSSQIQER